MTLPTHARTVIIGGGVIGCSIAYHLAREGRKDIVVLERSKLTSGTTWHAAGLVRRLRPSATLTKLINYSIDLYGELERETGQATGWTQTGSLTLATNQDRLTNIKRQVSLGRAFGLEAEVVDASRAKDLWPLIEVDDVIGAVWSPSDGRVNPSDVALALSKGARARGVQIFEDTRVTGLQKIGGRISGVEVGDHVIEADEVVIACGLWSREVAAMAGAHMPLYACEHFYILTKPLPEVQALGKGAHLPTLNDQDAFLYARDDVEGLLVGSFERHAKGLPLDRLPADFSFDLLDEDWDHFMPMMENALRRIPALEKAEVRMLLNGPESFTLDSQFMLGESPEVPGLFLMGGMNSTGIALAGGAGKAMAEWIIAGEPTMELNEADIRRFSPEMNVLGALEARIPEVLGRHYDNPFPGRSMETARGQRRSPIHAGLVAAGARFEARGGWERAVHFGGEPAHLPLTFGAPAWREQVGQEVETCRSGAAILDQSAFGKIMVQGPDACAFLNRLCAAQMDVPEGRIAYTQILNAKGGVESDLTVQRHGQETFLLIVGANETVRVMQRMRDTRSDYRAEFTDVTSGYAILGLAGARARDVLQATTNAAVPDLKRFCFAPVEIGLARGWAGRLSFTGEEGFELYIPADMAMAAYEALVTAGATHAGLYASGSLRIESGFRAFGHELTPGTTPLEAGLGAFCAMGTGFVGEDALRDHSPERQIVSILFDDPDAIPLHDEPIYFDGKVVGQITSAAWSYRFGRSVALGLINAPLGLLETQDVLDGFEVEIACARYTAKASLKPVKVAFA
ncbi:MULTISPECIES: FAD-dependent oxidoreductase [unclassified Ruegeria]|uniref:GcvT family protein n=1 Tax=unclassified Ruegeria TaxID=2625375 RepID=UPI0014879B8C|nr:MULTISPECIES: FAD-dependent oxidoreductase [unclassified Ruegeria]NOD77871.1 FAD-dependent oxidoreductase [Ruegeria sp. HKCCD4332]NOD88102.1 FAD-dependent oxidoreductase [Ruegeria sp. HKCCD4318]NOE14950.1 FAD-dependent oxidoreductase [Ruegeria sp. HKCCD4318-2]NOG11447.1 FAD-dependent oxidoreductase [Ruegeria sp. HKCCD4315]